MALLYQFTPLDQLEEVCQSGHSRANIYGVVRYSSYRGRGKGSSYVLVVSLHNKKLYSENKRFVITVFEDNEAQLPTLDVGDIVRFKNLKIDRYRGSVNGTCSRVNGTSWMVVSNDQVARITARSSSSSKPPIDERVERPIVEELREWVKRANPCDLARSADSSPVDPNSEQPALSNPLASPSKREGSRFQPYPPTSPGGQADTSIAPFIQPQTSKSWGFPTDLHGRLENIQEAKYTRLDQLRLASNCSIKLRVLAMYHWQEIEDDTQPSDRTHKFLHMTVTDGTLPSLELKVLDVTDATSTRISSDLDTVPGQYRAGITVYGKINIINCLNMNVGGYYSISSIRPMLYKRVGIPECYIQDRFRTTIGLLDPESTRDINKRLSNLRGSLNLNVNSNIASPLPNLLSPVLDYPAVSPRLIAPGGSRHRSKRPGPKSRTRNQPGDSSSSSDDEELEYTRLLLQGIEQTPLTEFSRLPLVHRPQVHTVSGYLSSVDVQVKHHNTNRWICCYSTLQGQTITATDVENSIISLDVRLRLILRDTKDRTESTAEVECICMEPDLFDLCGLNDSRVLINQPENTLKITGLVKSLNNRLKLSLTRHMNRNYVTHTYMNV